MRAMRLVATVLCGVGLACGAPVEIASVPRASAVAMVPAVPSAPPQPKPWAVEIHRELELRIGEQKLGDITMAWIPLEGGGFRLSMRSTMSMTKVGSNEPLTNVTEEIENYDASLLLTSSQKVEREGAIVMREEQLVEHGQLRVVVDKPSHHDEKTVKIPADWSNATAAFAALREKVIDGAALPQELGYSSFDPDDMTFTRRTVKLVARTRLDTPGGPVDGWKIEIHDVEKGDVIRGVADDAGVPLEVDFGAARLVLRGTPGATAGVAEIDSSLPMKGALRANTKTAEVEVTVKGDAAEPLPIFLASPYQDVVRRGDVYALSLKVRGPTAAVTPPTLPMQALPGDVARFLSATADSQSTAPTIVARAKQIVGAERDSKRAGRAIVQWVYKNLQKKSGARGSASAVEALEAGVGDCTEHTALTVALARAAGIPARNTTGIVLVPGKKAQGGYHAWPELWLGEWVAMDPALGFLDVGPSYVWLGYDEPGDTNGGGSLMRLIGRTSLEIK